MKVVIVTSLERGGPLDHAVSLAGGLVKLGAEVSAVCAGRAAAERFHRQGARPLVAPLRHQLDAWGATRVLRLTRGADVVHAQDRRSGLWTRLMPRRRGGPRRVYTFHGLPDPYLPEQAGLPGPSLRDRLAYERLDGALARRSDAVIVPSQYMARVVEERLHFPAAKLAVVPNGVEASAAVAGGRLVGTVSVLEPVKALDVFLRAAARVGEHDKDARFACFGDGSARERLVELAASLGLAQRMSFPGHVPVQDALGELRVFALCSWMENSPMALMQAMAVGLPTVATNVGGVPEIADGVAELVPAGDADALAAALQRIMRDDALAARLGAAGRVRVQQRFTAERNARDVLTVYERVLSR
ncbi:MAG TPA: glycosyltransferase family 4 protein [Thermoleophilaceae bacterium]